MKHILTRYFQSYKNDFWQYEEMGKLISVPNSNTIGYSQLILGEIVPNIAAQGLPRFSSLLLAVIATNTNYESTLDEILKIMQFSNKDIEYSQEGFQLLENLHRLPNELKIGKQRIELFRILFENSHNSLKRTKSEHIQSQLSDFTDMSLYPDIFNKKVLPNNKHILDFKTLSIIHKKLDSTEKIINRLTSVSEAKLEIVETVLESFHHQENTLEAFIHQLKRNNKTFHISQLIESIIGGFNISFHSNVPSKQPLGGISDITNKGNYDKLLISEFANDDLTFISRLTNQEALYTHREIPPQNNNKIKVIIIDHTLKNWGTIKEMAFATMFAIKKHPKNKTECKVYLVGKSYHEVKVETINDIIQAIFQLDSTLDPGVGLLKLFQENKELIQHEIFYIGTSESNQEPRYQYFLAQYGKHIRHMIYPNAQGKLEIYKNTFGNKRLIQQLSLDLDTLWNKTKTSERRKIANDTTYPILFPTNIKGRPILSGKYFTYVTTKSKSIYRFYTSRDKTNAEKLEWITSYFNNTHSLKCVLDIDTENMVFLVLEPKKVYSLYWPKSGDRITLIGKLNPNYYWKFYSKDNYFIGTANGIQVKINLDGKIEDYTELLNSSTKLSKAPNLNYSNESIYRRINEISINSSQKIQIGKHELILFDQSLIFVHQKENHNNKIAKAKQLNMGVYSFDDGSVIRHHPDGILILESSNNLIPKIYLTCVLGQEISVATQNFCSGTSKYQMRPLYQLFIEKSNLDNEKLKMIVQKHLPECTNQLNDKNPERIELKYHCDDELLKIQRELKENKIDSKLFSRGIVQKELELHEFYSHYIKVFISEIINHGH